MSALMQNLTLVSALGSATVAGVFYAYSTFTMSGFARLAPETAVAAMQAINREAPKAPLMLLMFGTAAPCVVLMAASLGELSQPAARLQLLAGFLYLAGAVLLTGVYHVPRNDLLAALEPGSAEAAAYWGTYLDEWVRMNHLRTAAPLAAALLFLLSLRLP